MEKTEPILSYETQGFVHLPGVLEPAFLARFKASFDRTIAKHNEKWLAAGEAATPSFDIPRILDEDDIFVDLVDLPTVFPLLVEILGYDIQLIIAQARIFRPALTFVPPWHSDLDGVRGIDPGVNPRFMAKIHFYPEDLTPEQGCLAFIPGSHRYSIGTPRPRISYSQDSPLFKKIVPKAGDAVLFNPHIFHMCLDKLERLCAQVTDLHLRSFLDEELSERRPDQSGAGGHYASEETTLWSSHRLARRPLRSIPPQPEHDERS